MELEYHLKPYLEPKTILREWQVKERWDIDQIKLAEFVYKDRLRALDINGKPLSIFDFDVAVEVQCMMALRRGEKPDPDNEFKLQLEIFAPLISQFSSDDIIDFERKNNLIHGQQTTEKLDELQAKAFIESLSMSYISDTEIGIKRGDKRMDKVDKITLGFKTKESRAKIWNAFINAFKTKDHYFNLKTTDAPSKDAARKYLEEINNKLIVFLFKRYKIELPDKFKLYEKVTTETGSYKFKFNISEYKDADILDLNKLSDEDLLSKINGLAAKYSEIKKSGTKGATKFENQIMDRLHYACQIALQRDLIDNDDVNIILSGKED